MRKVWQSHRKDGKGVNVQWFDDTGRRRTKFFSPKHARFIKPFMASKFIELNGDCRLPADVVSVPWQSLVEAYIESLTVRGLVASTIKDTKHILGQLGQSCGVSYTKNLTQADLDRYILARRTASSQRRKGRKVSPHTVNKEIRVISAFLVFAQERAWLGRKLAISESRAPLRPPRVLGDSEARRLVLACGKDRQWRMRILLLLCTGLRISAVDAVRVRDIDIERKTLSAAESKTKKAYVLPLPDALIPELTRYLLEVVPDGQTLLFSRRAGRKRWYSIRKRAGLADITPHTLRKTYASMQASAGSPMPVVQKLLGHSSVDTTLAHYVAVPDELARKSVNTLKVEEWL